MFEIRGNQFYLNGKPFQIISGSIHYFRTVPEYWRDRLEKLRNMGCNTVETYIPWNFHEPERGTFLWQGWHDVCRFIRLAQELKLYVIIRPSPYICAEWELGGLPPWLLADRAMRLRCLYPPYLAAVRAYYEELLPRLVPYQIDRGGPIILMQVENEYGYYGNDTAYLEFLRDTMRSLGVTVPLVTSDGPWSESAFKAGCVAGALPTANFGSNVEWQFDVMQRYIGKDTPLMCMEFWAGWFDAWGDEAHHTSDLDKNKTDLRALLRRGHLNFYMFEGGTNFGFMSGRNSGNRTADVTSYDYDAPLTEDGQITPKYRAFRDIIAEHAPVREVPLSTAIVRREYGAVPCAAKVGLFATLAALAQPVHSMWPLTMEDVGQGYGYILYRVPLAAGQAAKDILLEGAADRVQCFADGRPVFTAANEVLSEKHTPAEPVAAAALDFLCENVGRENFGTSLESQRKGIAGGIQVNGHRHFGLDIYPLPLDAAQVACIDFSAGWQEQAPAFYKFEFTVQERGDTFLDVSGFGRGCAFINGFNLGRFWSIGPQRRLYIPAPLLNAGANTLILFETEGQAAAYVTLCGEPRLAG